MDLNAENSYGGVDLEISHSTLSPSPARHAHGAPSCLALCDWVDHGQSKTYQHGLAQLTHMASSNSKACDVKCHLHITRFMISCDELLCADWEADH